MPINIRTSCDGCGDVEVGPHQLSIHIDACGKVATKYTFLCPSPEHDEKAPVLQVKDCEGRVRDLLVEAGVVAVRYSSESSELQDSMRKSEPGQSLDIDTVIDFGLLSVDDFNALISNI